MEKEKKTFFPPFKKSFLQYKTSFLTLISIFYAIYKGRYKLLIAPLSIFLTSINYWRDPKHGFRRNLDISIVYFMVLYQLYYTRKYQGYTLYIFTQLTSVSFYILSRYVSNYLPELSYQFHGLLHLFYNISNVIIYT